MKITNILDRSNGGAPVQANSQVRVIIGGMQGTRIETFQVREGAEAAIGSGPALDESLFVDLTRPGQCSESTVPIPAFHIKQKIGNRLLRSAGIGCEARQS